MEFTFNLFKPRKARNPKSIEPLVAVRPNGRIVFNKQASELLDNHHYCMLGYDPDNRALGVLPLDTQDTNAFPVRYAAKGAYIGAKKFFRHFNILPEQLVENSPFKQGQFIGIKM
ncbi:MAG: hypothetical protein H6Q73_3839 [Firmicutes bacterium]|nr:hypothetical protein [Bacillota bacterium]